MVTFNGNHSVGGDQCSWGMIYVFFIGNGVVVGW